MIELSIQYISMNIYKVFNKFQFIYNIIHGSIVQNPFGQGRQLSRLGMTIGSG